MRLQSLSPESFKDVFKDAMSLLGKILVGFVFILEILFFSIRPPLMATPEFLTKFLTFRISPASTMVILIFSYLVGYFFILIYQLVVNILICLSEQPALGRFFEPIVNYLFPEPLSRDSRLMQEAYRRKVLNRVGRYFDLPSLVGGEFYRLSRQFCTKHKNLFKTHMIMLDQSLSQGLFVNFVILSFYAIFSKIWWLVLLSLLAMIMLLIEIRNISIRLRRAVYDVTYLTILLEEKEQKLKGSSN